MSAREAVSRVRQVVPVLLCVVLGSCRVDVGVRSQFQPQVINQTDNFQFLASGVSNLTRTVQYTWQTTGTRANVAQSSNVTVGTATLTIRDALGTQLYSNDLRADGNFVTTSGAAGAWTIEVALTGVSGAVSFRVQKGS